MDPVPGTATFAMPAAAYDGFMGRYSTKLAVPFADFAGIRPGVRALDVGCGPGALTAELARRLGAASVAGCDPSPHFLAACRERNPGVDLRAGSAEQVPFDAAGFDAVLAQLVLHFVGDPERAAAEFIRVARPGAVLAACVWDLGGDMQLLRSFWDAALSIDPDAPAEARGMRFGRQGEIAGWLADAGLAEVTEATLSVTSEYTDFDEVWATMLAGVGPAGSYCAALPPEPRQALRAAWFAGLGRPSGSLTLRASAWAARAVLPGEPPG